MKAKVCATMMVLASFDSQGIVYNHYVPKGKTVNCAYIVKVLQEFLRSLKKKRPTLESGDWFQHWDNAPVDFAKLVKEYLAKRGVQMIAHPHLLPQTGPCGLLLVSKAKKELAGATMIAEEFK